MMGLPLTVDATAPTADGPDLPTVDISAETGRHVVIASGTGGVYRGHPTTRLLPDNRTMLCVSTSVVSVRFTLQETDGKLAERLRAAPR